MAKFAVKSWSKGGGNERYIWDGSQNDGNIDLSISYKHIYIGEFKMWVFHLTNWNLTQYCEADIEAIEKNMGSFIAFAVDAEKEDCNAQILWDTRVHD